jgi:hypothetical protein
MQGSAPCMAVVFLLAQKDDGKMRQAFPLHSLRSASAVTLLLLKLRIVHRRMVHASVSAPQGADPLSFRAKRGIPHSEAYAVDGDSSALARLRMTGGLYIFQVTQVNARSAKTTQTQCVHKRFLRAMLNGRGFRHGKQTTRAAALVFFLVTFSKMKKSPGAGTESPRLRPRRARWRGRLAAGLRALHPVTFRSCGKSPKARQGFPLHSLRSASAVTLLPAELLIVHSRNVPAFISALRADKKRICKFFKLHTSTRGARNRRKHNATTSGTHSGNDKRSGLTKRQGNY